MRRRPRHVGAVREPPTTAAVNSYGHQPLAVFPLRLRKTRLRALRSHGFRIGATRSVYRPGPMLPTTTGINRGCALRCACGRRNRLRWDGLECESSRRVLYAVHDSCCQLLRASTAGCLSVAPADDEFAGIRTVANANYATHPVGAVREPPKTAAVNAHTSGMALPIPALADDEFPGWRVRRNAHHPETRNELPE